MKCSLTGKELLLHETATVHLKNKGLTATQSIKTVSYWDSECAHDGCVFVDDIMAAVFGVRDNVVPTYLLN